VSTELSRQFAEVRQRVHRQQQLNRREAEIREALNQETYRYETFETQLNMISEELHKLEGFGLNSLLSGIMGHKQERIDAARQSSNEVTVELESSRAALANLQAELDAVVPELAGLRDSRDEYEVLCSRREEEILASSGDHADQLRSLSFRQEHLKERLRSARKAADAAESVLHGLNTAKISVRQVNKRRLAGEGLAGDMYNAFMSQALRPSRSALATAMDKLLAVMEAFLGELDCEGSPEERELSASIQAYRSRFSACPVLEEDCDALVECETDTAALHRSMRDRASTIEHQLRELATQRLTIIEQA
jgi:hypothetical protein